MDNILKRPPKPQQVAKKIYQHEGIATTIIQHPRSIFFLRLRKWAKLMNSIGFGWNILNLV